jgi:hypothetical protein
LRNRILAGRWPFLFVAVLVAAFTISSAQAAQSPLRRLNWAAVLANDPNVTIDTSISAAIGPYVIVDSYDVYLTDTEYNEPEELSGHARLNGIMYVDLDRDGAEEAVIPLESGGTAGTTGFLVYRESLGGPYLAIGLVSYKLGIRAEPNSLLLSEPIYAGFEPNCCPSGTLYSRIVMVDDALVVMEQNAHPNQEATVVAVYAFYDALRAGRYADAYDFLSPRYQAGAPFASWAAGYHTTESIEVDAQAVPNSNEVRVRITAVDRTNGGGSRTRHFTGSWYLVWSNDAGHWLLDRADISDILDRRSG